MMIKWLKTIVLSILSASCVFNSVSCISPSFSDTEETSLLSQGNQIMVMLGKAGDGLRDGITLIEEIDSGGNPYYVGVIDAKLNIALEALVETYNEDPSTTATVTLEEVRYKLSDGITNASLDENADDSFMLFIRWLGAPADLVDQDGNKVETKTLTNFNFVVEREIYSEYQHSWE